ncbi:MAG: CGGC domain-containing protein, partial [Clostridia bacterium]|nr:CGGC domain-containing protein [Clostridia bacterium]
SSFSSNPARTYSAFGESGGGLNRFGGLKVTHDDGTETLDLVVEKLERLVSEGVETVHIGVCAGREEETACPGMKKMVEAFREKGLEVIWGTH